MMRLRNPQWAAMIQNLEGARTRGVSGIYRHVPNPLYQSRALLKLQFSSPALPLEDE